MNGMNNSMKVFFFSLAILLFVSGLTGCSQFSDGPDLSKAMDKSTSAQSELPTAKVLAPLFNEEGVEKNKAIIISFSKPMNTAYFKENLSITDTLGNNLKGYFLEPEWANENTLVRIPVNEKNLLDLKGKKSFDIYVSLSKSYRAADDTALKAAIDYKYRVCEKLDKTTPGFKSIKAELPGEYIGNPSGAAISLVEGNLSAESETSICKTNHINSKLDFYVEGTDYTNSEVWAYLKYRRVYDVNGNEVNDTERVKLVKLSNVNQDNNSFEKFCLDLSSSEYLDGMYKIYATVSDASAQASGNYRVYYVIRDTVLEFNANSLIMFETPSFDKQQPTLDLLNYYRTVAGFNYISDDVYFVSKISDAKKTYKKSREDYTYLFSWGTSLENMSSPVAAAYSDQKYILPDACKSYCERNKDKDIYLVVSFADAVGNTKSITTLIPKEIEFHNYSVSEADDGYKKVSLNYSEFSKETAAVLQDKTYTISYRVYYGRIVDTKDSELSQIALTYNTNANCNEFIIPDGTEYAAFIQPVYNFFSKSNGQASGQSLGPLYKVIVDSKLAFYSSMAKPSFSVSKESSGESSGLYQINIYLSNPQNDIRYVPCFSIDDGENWINYNSVTGLTASNNSFSFVVTNPLKAPFAVNEEWGRNALWSGKDYFTAVQDVQGEGEYRPVTALVKVLAVKDNEVRSSDVIKINFEEKEDNIPPVQSSSIISHDSVLSYDGHSYKFNSLIKEEEGHLSPEISYYYMPYNEAWGNDLYVADSEQISMLPGGVGNYDSITWLDDKDGALYSVSPVVYVNGIKDGSYMFFAKVSDTYGNYNYITLGKAHIGTFKNKLSVEYDENKNSLVSKLTLEADEVFDRNMINIQLLEKSGWINFYGKQNELQNCRLIDRRTALYNETNASITRIEGKSENSYTVPLEKGRFYRITMQGFNENTYNPATNTGVNAVYGRPYSNNAEQTTVVENLENETEYDLCTDETVSNTVYYYVPAEKEDFKSFKASFFASTAAPRSNKPFIVNVISSANDLGSNIDEWERRGKLIKTYYYEGSNDSSAAFNDSTAAKAMLEANEKGSVFYVAIVHFADNSSAISSVYRMQ